MKSDLLHEYVYTHCGNEVLAVETTLLLELKYLPLFGFEFERGVIKSMKTHIKISSLRNVTGNALARIFVLCFFAFAISGQAPPVAPLAPENIQTGALIIAMDNFNQGNGTSTTFNLRAYGLVNLLLQNDIPVKWAIRQGKAKDAVDFTVSVTRITPGPVGDPGPGSVAFSGGPFIVTQEYDTAAVRALITSFNSGAGDDVQVYKTNAAVSADIRYTLTHKPKIAIGPDGGNFGSGVHQALFDSAGIGPAYYDSVTDDIVNSNSCYTLATQAHSTSSNFVNLYKQFVQSGGNLLLQCASINTFENNINGRFQTTLGYTVFGTNDGTAVSTPLLYPDGAMPFNQFIGVLADQDGAATEYAYAPGSGPANGNVISVTNTGVHSNKFVATVSQLGGTVFELGGHDYRRTNTGASLIERLNGQRMILNAVFVPVTRPTDCNIAPAGVVGFKSVRVIENRAGGPPAIAGETLVWTINYINNSPVTITNFQIRDIIQANLTLVPNSNLVTFVTAGSSATRNASYDGVGNDSTSDLLAPGATLLSNGRITVEIRTVINANTPAATILRNQTIASGGNLASTANSDNIDATNTNIFGVGTTPDPTSVPQTQNPASIDPTTVGLAPTAADASVDGSVRDSNGRAIFNALVTATNAGTGVSTSARTNSSGQYRIDGLESGDLYFVRVTHTRYRFPSGSVTFTLSDNVTGLAFVGEPISVKGTRGAVAAAAKLRR